MLPFINIEDLIREWLGKDSVYVLVMRDIPFGWAIATSTVVLQILTFYLFYRESSVDFEDENYLHKAWVYSYGCPRDSENAECEKELITSPLGWLVFAILMTFNLLTHLVNGLKILWTAPRLDSYSKKLRAFVGGLILVAIFAYSLFVTICFNIAGAVSNTELIMNAVILLFINDFDEHLLMILVSFFPHLRDKLELNEIEKLKKESNVMKEENAVVKKEYYIMKGENAVIKKEYDDMKEENAVMMNKIEQLFDEIEILKRKGNDGKEKSIWS